MVNSEALSGKEVSNGPDLMPKCGRLPKPRRGSARNRRGRCECEGAPTSEASFAPTGTSGTQWTFYLTSTMADKIETVSHSFQTVLHHFSRFLRIASRVLGFFNLSPDSVHPRSKPEMPRRLTKRQGSGYGKRDQFLRLLWQTSDLAQIAMTRWTWSARKRRRSAGKQAPRRRSVARERRPKAQSKLPKTYATMGFPADHLV